MITPDKILEKSYKEFIDTIYPKLPLHNSTKDHLISAINNVSLKSGYYLEFGVYRGSTITLISESLPNKIIYGFDSFKGLPEKWNNEHFVGSYNLNGQAPSLNNSNIKLIEGWFETSIPNFINDNNINYISFIHLDADLYLSTSCVFTLLNKYFINECVFVFNEFCNYPDAQLHEYRAFYEFLETKQVKDFQYLGRSDKTYSQVSFKIWFN